MTSTITVSIWHNVTRDPQGRPAGYDGFTPGDQIVRVFCLRHRPARARPRADRRGRLRRVQRRSPGR